VFEDTESASGFFWIYKCFASAILTTSCFKKELGAKQIRINSYKEFAYLHKNYFHPSLKVSEDNPQKKVIFRFVSHNVNHDKRGDGLTPGMKAALINRISGMANVYVSTEKGLTQQFPDLELQITPENMHHLMASFQLLIGESATMAAEAAVIGIPSIFFDNHGRGYTDELEEKYHLINNFPVSESSIENAIIRATEILNKTNYMKDHRGHKRLLSDKIDVTAFLIWFVENFPKSMDMMKQHPEYQNRFR
jgi:predicted glycosyltransferase